MRRMLVVVVVVVGVWASPAQAAPIRWGCEPQPVWIDPRFTYSERREIVRALAELERATFRSWPVTDDPEAPVSIEEDDPNRYWWGAGAVTMRATDGTSWVSARVIVSPLTPPDLFRLTVLHELGHVAGLAHASEPDLVMSEWGRGPDRYTVRDLLRLAATRCR